MAEAAAVQREPDTDQQRKDAETAKGSSLTLSDLGTFEIISFSFSESRPGSGGSGTQAPNPREIHVTRVPDENSTKIQELALKGESIGSMQIVTSTGAIVGTKVIIASFNVAASRDRPIESFTLAVGEPGFTFQPAGAAAP